MSHVTHEWVMSHMNKSSHIWLRHVKYEWVMAHMLRTDESCHRPQTVFELTLQYMTWPFAFFDEGVLSHMHESYVTWSRKNKSCQIWMSHVTHEWVMPHINESYHTWMSHITHERVMSRTVCMLLRRGSLGPSIHFPFMGGTLSLCASVSVFRGKRVCESVGGGQRVCRLVGSLKS